MRAGLPDRRQTDADRQFAGDEVGATRGATRLGVVVGEDRPLGGELVDVRRLPGHHAAVVGADVPDADVVAHHHDDVGFLSRNHRSRSKGNQRHCRKDTYGDFCGCQFSHKYSKISGHPATSGPLSRKLKEKFLCDLCDSSEAGGESMSKQL